MDKIAKAQIAKGDAAMKSPEDAKPGEGGEADAKK